MKRKHPRKPSRKRSLYDKIIGVFSDRVSSKKYMENHSKVIHKLYERENESLDNMIESTRKSMALKH
jgi:hypothetical protein